MHRVRRHPPAWLVLAVAALIVVVTGCSSSEPPRGAPRSCITNFDATTDYFPDKVSPHDADNFRIAYHRSYAVLTVPQPYPGGKPQSYVLVRCGAPKPTLDTSLTNAPYINVPVSSLYAGSTTQIPPLVELGALDALTGVADGSLISNQQVRQRVEDKRVAVYSRGGTINTEAVLAAKPDVVLTEGVDAPAYAKIADAGIGVVAGADWLESTPLGRAEWIKVIALLTGHEATANQVYDGIAQRYRQIADTVRSASAVPVLSGTMYQGTWSVPAGGSHFGTLLKDAGARWPWQDSTGTGSLQLGFETVYTRAGQIPLWLVIDNRWTTTADVVATDPRYGTLAAVQSGQVWNANKAMGPGGGNDYLERGASRPDLVLQDLVAIVHPELVNDHRFVFYRPLTRS